MELWTTPGMRLALLLANVAATLFMAGVIWVVQLVHYPLFAQVGEPGWGVYHAAHARRMTLVVLLPMVIELGTAGLLILAPPSGLPRGLLWLGFVLALATWAATFWLSVPLHGKLGQGTFVAESHRALVTTNWLRTVVWSAHAAVVLEAVRRLLMR